MPTADELSAAVAALLKEEVRLCFWPLMLRVQPSSFLKATILTIAVRSALRVSLRLARHQKSGDMDVKQIHERLLKERNWKVPERRLNKFVKRHRSGGAAKEDEASPARKTTQGVLKKLFQRKSPEPAAKSVGGGGAKPAATVVTDQSPGRISAAASLESSVLPEPQDRDGVPSTIVTTTTNATITDTTSEKEAASAAVVAADEADVSAANMHAGNEEDDDAESKPCFMLPCEGMSCNVL
jgi:hypothetical protein